MFGFLAWRNSQQNKGQDLLAEAMVVLNTAVVPVNQRAFPYGGIEMARLFASCDVYLGPNRRHEGFGLPAAEALAGVVPAILTRIPSYLWWDDVHDYALFVDEEDSAAMGDALLRLLVDVQYTRNDMAFTRGSFRVRGDTV